jgi:hypothetical protein
MTMTTTYLEPFNSDQATIYLGHTSLLLPKFFLYLNLKFISIPERWAEVLTLSLPSAGPHV